MIPQSCCFYLRHRNNTTLPLWITFLYKFLVELGLTPQVLLEPQGEDKDCLWVCSLSAYEDIDWISIFLSETSKVRRISKQCNLTILNFGWMLSVAPRLFRYCDQGSMSSTMGQCGSASSLRLLQDGQNGSQATCICVPDNPNTNNNPL